MQFVRQCYGLRGIYGRFESKIRFEIESDGRFNRTQKNDSQVPRTDLIISILPSRQSPLLCLFDGRGNVATEIQQKFFATDLQ